MTQISGGPNTLPSPAVDTPAISLATGLRCESCGSRFEIAPMFEGCPSCADGGWAANLYVEYDHDRAAAAWRARSGGGLWRYAALLPIVDPANRLTLGEGDTPVVRVSQAATMWRQAWVKNEGANPTSSYKDRQCAAAVAKALDFDASVIAASSSGNHGAAAAAYAARAGRAAAILTYEDIDPEAVAFMQVFGSTVLRTTRRGRWALLAHGVRDLGWYPVSTYTPAPTGNPYGTEGYKTVAFELFEQLGKVPDWVVVPTSYGEGLSGIWLGFRQLAAIGITDRLPRMVAAEAGGGGPLANALERNLDRVEELSPFPTIATSIGATTATDGALRALRDSGGAAIRVPDDAMLRSQREVASEGIFLEAAGVAGIAALKLLPSVVADADPERDTAVAIGTASGLRQLHLLVERLGLPEAPVISPDPAALDAFLAGVPMRGPR